MRTDGIQRRGSNENEEDSFHESKDYRRFECKKWGVVTTIFEPPTEAIRRFLYRKEWCLVIVGDKGNPKQVIKISYLSFPLLIRLNVYIVTT
jgi:hypothetical protein